MKKLLYSLFIFLSTVTAQGQVVPGDIIFDFQPPTGYGADTSGTLLIKNANPAGIIGYYAVIGADTFKLRVDTTGVEFVHPDSVYTFLGEVFSNNITISDTFTLTAGTPGVGKVLSSNGGGDGSWVDITDLIDTTLWTITGTNVHLKDSTNNVAIGQSSASTKLDVLGTAQFTDDNSLLQVDNSNGLLYQYNDAAAGNSNNILQFIEGTLQSLMNNDDGAIEFIINRNDGLVFNYNPNSDYNRSLGIFTSADEVIWNWLDNSTGESYTFLQQPGTGLDVSGQNPANDDASYSFGVSETGFNIGHTTTSGGSISIVGDNSNGIIINGADVASSAALSVRNSVDYSSFIVYNDSSVTVNGDLLRTGFIYETYYDTITPAEGDTIAATKNEVYLLNAGSLTTVNVVVPDNAEDGQYFGVGVTGDIGTVNIMDDTFATLLTYTTRTASDPIRLRYIAGAWRPAP